EGAPCGGLGPAVQPLQCQAGKAVAGRGGQGQDGQVPDEFAYDDLPARYGVAEQQGQCAAVDFADDGVVGQQHGDERHQEDRQAGQADDGDGKRVDLDVAGGRAAQQAQGQRQRGQQQHAGGDQHGEGAPCGGVGPAVQPLQCQA